MRRRDRASLRRLCGEVHGRRRAVYFGYPQAHEDDAERAVRAGLELVAAVTALKTPRSPTNTRRHRYRSGGRRRPDRFGASQEQAIVGETPNLAARLQGIAEPNSVVIAESTRKLVGNLFELEDLGAKDLKGIAGPVRAWAALRASSAEGRFEALHATGLTELVGREEELELLLRRWSKAKTGEGQVVLLSGEAGIGKSRLTAALLERLTPSRTRACDISALRSTRTARFIRLSARWSVPLDWRTTTPGKRNSTSSMRCSHFPRPPNRMPRCLPRCYRCRTMDAIQHSKLPRSSADRKRSKPLLHNSSDWQAATSADDL